MITFRRINFSDVNWEEMQEMGNINVFQTKAWMDGVIHARHVEPVVIEIWKNDQLQGYFTGLLDKKLHLKILGSPFRGWNTYFMGFNLKTGISHKDVLRAFPLYAFKHLKCHYLEIIDPEIKAGDWDNRDYQAERLPWFAVDLNHAEHELFARLKGTCRTAIRKATKCGVMVEEATDLDFAEDYYEQYKDVLTRRGFVPAYKSDDVKSIIKNLMPTGDLLLLRAKNSDGKCIATQIFLSKNRTGVYWGGASWREYQSLRPSDLLMWSGMKILKARGVQEMHMGATVEDFKKKFGAYDDQIFRLKKANGFLLNWVIRVADAPWSMKFRNLMLRWFFSHPNENTQDRD